jgi:heavy metal translocating P-type ATPase
VSGFPPHGIADWHPRPTLRSVARPRAQSPAESRREDSLVALALAGLLGGAGLYVGRGAAAAQAIWAATTAVVLFSTCVTLVRRLLRKDAGVDIIAALAMTGALALGEYLAGAIIAVMLTGGAALERLAVARAKRHLAALLERAPRVAHRQTGEGVVDVAVDEVVPGDVLIVKQGEVVPVDGIVDSGTAVLDESALTGEPKPVTVEAGARVRSGGTNAGGPFDLRASAVAAESTYAGILRLVEAAEQSKPAFVRLADRYALGFVALTVTLAFFAWMVDHSATRALAVLVVATPCPILLAAPAAMIAGVSRAARSGIIVKGSGPLDTLARVRVLLLDKTGTVTSGRPQVTAVETFGVASGDEVVKAAASLEQLSAHPFAPALLAEAKARNLELTFPTDAVELMGTGIAGRVDGRRVAIGQLAFVAPSVERTPALRSVEVRTVVEGLSSVFVSIDGHLAGALLLQDPTRPEAPRALRALRAAGIERVHMVTGDHPDVAEMVGDAVGFDRVFAERTPAEKVEVIRAVRSEGITAMVGDGINDAPALALADVGIAMGARGATAASEAADVVLTADRLDGLLHATRIAKRTRRIALESIFVGMGLSLAAMMFAAAGYLTPIAGAVLQEGIDVLVILNALRALGGSDTRTKRIPQTRALGAHLASAHRALRPYVGELAVLASRLESLSPAEALSQLERTRTMLETRLLPHEREEQETAYPRLSRLLDGQDPTGPLIHTHQEIRRLSRLFGRLIAQLPPEGPAPEDLRDLRRTLYGLHAILTLHFAQEEELYSLFER